jgi:hypothetical protein
MTRRAYYQHLPKCDRCGRFHKCEPGSSYAMRFSGWPLTPDHEATRCLKCTSAFGPLEAQHGVRDCTAGIVSEARP